MSKPFVLIIEDDRDIAALFRHFMDLGGYRTEIASSGELALERLSSCEPDAVLLDLALPRTSGTHILQMMRSDARLKRTPVIVVTAYSELADTLPIEPDLLLMKPISSDQLIGLVERLRKKNERLETAALHEAPLDRVTRLYNRSFFMHRVDSAIQSMHSNGQSLFAVLSLTTTGYETIRRQHGEDRANEFLRGAAAVLRASVRPTDTVARFEGDRFHVLIEQAPGLLIPDMIAARIQTRLLAQLSIAEGQPITYSLGVLLCDNRYSDAGEILRDAQRCCELARAAGPQARVTFDHDSIGRDDNGAKTPDGGPPLSG